MCSLAPESQSQISDFDEIAQEKMNDISDIEGELM
jgi:hypothetical protein